MHYQSPVLACHYRCLARNRLHCHLSLTITSLESHAPITDSDHTPNGFVPSSIASQDKRIVPATYTEVPYNGAPDPGAEPESGGLLEYWRILRRRKSTLIVLASVGAVIGFLVTLPQTPIYQVRTSLEIVSLNQNFLNMKESNPLAESGSGADSTDIQTQIKLLQSGSLLERVIDKLHATGLPAAEPTRVDSWRKLLNLPDPHPVDPSEARPFIRRQKSQGSRRRSDPHHRAHRRFSKSPDCRCLRQHPHQ